MYISIIEQGKGNTQLIWENLRNITGKHKISTRNTELELEGKQISDHAMIANTFNSDFVDVISVLIKSICPDIPCIALMDGVLSKFTQTDVK